VVGNFFAFSAGESGSDMGHLSILYTKAWGVRRGA